MSEEHEIYKRYRPRDFDEMVGQSESVKILEKKLANNTLPRALLLWGDSRCGKTTAARILKEKLGCVDWDFTESNAADARGIDDIRDIDRRMRVSPIGKCRIYLIDEAHKLTTDAQNAFLKMLEDTPKTVYFFLATTDPQKLIPTVRKRCMPVEFKPLKDADMMTLLTGVCKKEKVKISSDVLDAIIERSDGSPGEALVYLDKIKELDDEDEQLSAIDKKEATKGAIADLCKLFCEKQFPSFKRAANIIKSIDDDAESVRKVVLVWLSKVLLDRGDKKTAYILDCFTRPYESGKPGRAGLAISVWQACNPG